MAIGAVFGVEYLGSYVDAAHRLQIPDQVKISDQIRHLSLGKLGTGDLFFLHASPHLRRVVPHLRRKLNDGRRFFTARTQIRTLPAFLSIHGVAGAASLLQEQIFSFRRRGRQQSRFLALAATRFLKEGQQIQHFLPLEGRPWNVSFFHQAFHCFAVIPHPLRPNYRSFGIQVPQIGACALPAPTQRMAFGASFIRKQLSAPIGVSRHIHIAHYIEVSKQVERVLFGDVR